MQLFELNQASESLANTAFSKCCSATRWASIMVDSRPYQSLSQIQDNATSVWQNMQEEDFLEAFDGHPKIGDPDSLKKKYHNTHAIASNEQSEVEHASDQTLKALAELNTLYQEKFGYIFIVCASGKPAQEMQGLIRSRMQNDPANELQIAAREQAKITALRIDKLIEIDSVDEKLEKML